MTTDYNLVSFNLCPFVQRSVITLEEKGAPYTLDTIDLYDKPDWFLQISPLGKVPILRVDDAVIFESAVISEYIEETAPGPALHPRDPLKRAHNRAWIEVASELIRKAHGLFIAGDEPVARRAVAKIREVISRFEEVIGKGPYFNVADFSLVDAAAAPPLQRLTWCEAIEPSLELLAQAPGVGRWRDALLARPSVQRSTIPELQEIFTDYLKGRGSPSRRAEPSWLGTRA